MTMRLPLLLSLLLFCLSGQAGELSIEDGQGNEIAIQTLPAKGDLLIVWLVDHMEQRDSFEDMLTALNRLDVEIWRVDLLGAYFLPRSRESVRTLSGDGVAAVIDAAHRLSGKRILLAACDRMPLPLLRGVHTWQLASSPSRLLGAVLFYPNLFGAAPLAGEPPQVDPILHATNIPLVIYQPTLGSQRWRLEQILEPLWQAGSPTYVYLVPDVRDWFFMGEGDHGPGEQTATDAVPRQLIQLARLLKAYPPPNAAKPGEETSLNKGEIRTLVELPVPRQHTPFTLQAMDGTSHASQKLQGRVVLLNFWATWCPPCVEELPSLNRLQRRYGGRDLQIVSVDFRESPREMDQFLRRTPVEFPVLMDNDGRLALAWGVFSFPSSFLIDRQGRIRYSANRAIDWDSPEIWRILDGLLDTP